MSLNADLLNDEISLRRASINDAQLEYDSGELSATDFTALQQREMAAIALCSEKIAALGQISPTNGDAKTTDRRPMRRHRRGYLVAALVCFAVAATVLVVNAATPRQPGSSETGGITTSQAQQIRVLLTEAELDQASGRSTYALEAFNQVLAIDKKNVEALTQSGWISFTAGSAAQNLSLLRLGEKRVALAVATYPHDPDPLLYYAIIAASTPGKRNFAKQEFQKFLRLHPTASERATAQPWLIRLAITSR